MIIKNKISKERVFQYNDPNFIVKGEYPEMIEDALEDAILTVHKDISDDSITLDLEGNEVSLTDFILLLNDGTYVVRSSVFVNTHFEIVDSVTPKESEQCISWRDVFDSKKFYGHYDVVRKTAESVGYSMFLFNNKVYSVDDEYMHSSICDVTEVK
jgi:serine/threonine protein kinase